MNVRQLYDLGLECFSKRTQLMSLWQEIAENFYPERADFTVRREMGNNFADNLMSSYPVLVRRELANQLSTMLRPTAKTWFHAKVRYKDNPGNELKVFLEKMEETQRRAMYDPRAMLNRAAKEGDHDFAAFGQAVLSIELNHNADGLLYRCWHIRDVAWQENEQGSIGCVFRKWKANAIDVVRTFPGSHEKIKALAEKSPFEKVTMWHMVTEADMFSEKTSKPRWSIWYDPENKHTLEQKPINGKHYIIPRWQTVSGSQYAYSPATITSLSDARLLQAITYTLLEAGEKATNPPMVATQDIIRSDVSVFAGGITWVDPEYDERLGDALRPLTQDFRGLNFGAGLADKSMAMLQKAFFLDTLNMPQRGPEMTAYEVGQRVQEYIRNALPIFEPMETEYNAALCDETMDILWRNGAFGDPRSWPEEIHGQHIDFTFESPLHDAIEQQKAHKFRESHALIAEAMAIDPSLGAIPKAEVALRDALTGLGAPARWLNSEAEVADIRKKQKLQEDMQQQMQMMQQGADVANKLGVQDATYQKG